MEDKRQGPLRNDPAVTECKLGSLLQRGSSPRAAGKWPPRGVSAPAPALPSPLLLLWPCRSLAGLSLALFSSLPAGVSPFLERVFPEVPPAGLTGSAVPCGGAGWKRLEAAPPDGDAGRPGARTPPTRWGVVWDEAEEVKSWNGKCKLR